MLVWTTHAKSVYQERSNYDGLGTTYFSSEIGFYF
jgi:hypothetical protein